MRYIIATLLFMSISLMGSAQDKWQTITIKTSIVCDHCMDCDDCGFNIDTQVRKVKGIRKVQINPLESTVDVTYNTDKTTPEEIRVALSRSGFDADDVKADPEAYSRLDECCKKD